MSAATHQFSFNGGLLQRGFWLYVWEIAPPARAKLYYVGRTGDSSSLNAQSPFNRMGQHLGLAKNSNTLRRHLEAQHVQPEHCLFRLVAHGPILGEVKDLEGYRKRRDIVAALERALAVAMCEAGYKVMNTVNCRVSPDAQQLKQIRSAFATEFPRLRHTGAGGTSQRDSSSGFNYWGGVSSTTRATRFLRRSHAYL